MRLPLPPRNMGRITYNIPAYARVAQLTVLRSPEISEGGDKTDPVGASRPHGSDAGCAENCRGPTGLRPERILLRRHHPFLASAIGSVFLTRGDSLLAYLQANRIVGTARDEGKATMGTGTRAMAERNAERRDFQHPDETRSFDNGKLDLIRLGGGVVGRFTLEPGWRWSQHVRPMVNTKWCEAPHFYYQTAGRLHIRTAEGDEFETRSGDVTALRAEHDAWVVGEEAVVLIDWSGAADYGKQAVTKPSVGPSDSRGGRATVPE